MSLHHNTLTNGLETVIKENHFSKMVAVQVWVATGSINELPEERGMAHLIEHMLFKGTKKRKVGQISQEVEAWGGDMNAYTTFDRTVYYLTVSSQYAVSGIELLADVVFNSVFDAEELEKEKEVVVEEIKRSLDNPSSLMGRRMFERMYQRSEVGRPIIGSVESVRSFTRDDVLNFYKKWYQPNNMKLVVVGDINGLEVQKTVADIFGANIEKCLLEEPRVEISHVKGLEAHIIKGDFSQPRIEIGFHGPQLEDYHSLMLDLAAFTLGVGDGSRFNTVICETKNLAGSVSASLYSPKFEGLFEVSALTDEENFLETIEELVAQTFLIRNVSPVTEQELDRARATLEVEKVLRDEVVSGQARYFGFSLTTKYKTLYDKVYETYIRNANVHEVAEAARKYLTPDRAVIVCLLPSESTISENDVKAAFEKGRARIEQAERKLVPPAVISKDSKAPIEIVPIVDGIQLVYRRNADSKMFNMLAVAEGGQRLETNETQGFFNALSSLFGTSSENLSDEYVTEIVEKRGGALYGFSGKDSVGFKLQCLSSHGPELMEVLFDCFLRPKFSEKKWQASKREILEEINSELDAPSAIAMREFKKAIFPDHCYGLSLNGTPEIVQALTAADLETQYRKFSKAGPWTIACVSDLEIDVVRDLVTRQVLNTKFLAKREGLKNTLPKLPAQEKLHLAKDKEQAHVLVGMQGLTWFDQRRSVLDVVSAILGGSGGRLFVELRDKRSLAYTVSPILSYGCAGGLFGSYIACSPEKVEEAEKLLLAEWQNLAQKSVSKQELERAVNYLVGNHEEEYQRGEAQAMTMGLMQSFGIGCGDFLTYSDKIRKVSSENIKTVMNEIINDARLVKVVVGPKE
ncbi:MAG: M16 family metallopeptidase [Oligoflexales bacterium]